MTALIGLVLSGTIGQGEGVSVKWNQVLATTNDVSISTTDSPFGLSFARVEKFGEEPYRTADKALSGTKVTTIIRRVTSMKTIAWNLYGNSISLKKDDVPKEVLARLGVDQIAVKVYQPIVPHSPDLPTHRLHFPFHDQTDSSNHIDHWGIYTVPDAPYVDLQFQILGLYLVGELDSKPGFWTEIDGNRFEVLNASPQDERPGYDSRRVVQSGNIYQWNYSLSINFNRALYVSEHPKEPNAASGVTEFEPKSPDSGTFKGDSGMIVSAQKGTRYWKSITVKRGLTLGGIIGRVPTQPH